MATERYHVWAYSDKRRRRLVLIEDKNLNSIDEYKIAAVWNSRPAAHQWAKRHYPGSYIVLPCECGAGVGFDKYHRETAEV